MPLELQHELLPSRFPLPPLVELAEEPRPDAEAAFERGDDLPRVCEPHRSRDDDPRQPPGAIGAEQEELRLGRVPEDGEEV